MTITKRAARLGVGIAALALVGTGFSGTASAAASDCKPGWFCVWSDQNYTGRKQQVEGNNADLSPYTVFANGSLSGFNNGRSCDVNIYAGKNYTKFIATVKRGYKSTGTNRVKILSNKWVNCK
ncbi:peptidase inhibitor family I36 protein [Streptomyces sp. NPDC002533]